jgi:hypothetical protein
LFELPAQPLAVLGQQGGGDPLGRRGAGALQFAEQHPRHAGVLGHEAGVGQEHGLQRGRVIGAASPAASSRASNCSDTRAMTASRMASLVAKWRNSAPWVRPMCWAIAVVEISPGSWRAASAITASTVAARRSSAGRCLVRMFTASRVSREETS